MPVADISIRPMRDADALAMHAIHERAVRKTCAPLLSTEIVEAWLRDRSPEGYLRGRDQGGETFLIAENRGLRAGFASWRGNELMSLFIDPDHQGMGVGRLLFEACDADAAAAGSRITRLHATLNARPFYEAAGFRAGKAGFDERFGERIPHIEMTRF